MGKGRLEAFSDGVLAIIITIMMLQMDVPQDPTLAAFNPPGPDPVGRCGGFHLCGHLLSNPRHLLHACKRVTGSMLWANLYLLFWLSLPPFANRWMDEDHTETLPTAT